MLPDSSRANSCIISRALLNAILAGDAFSSGVLLFTVLTSDYAYTYPVFKIDDIKSGIYSFLIFNILYPSVRKCLFLIIKIL